MAKKPKDATPETINPALTDDTVLWCPLLRAGVPDSAGDVFTVKSLHDAVEAFQKKKTLLVTKDFTGHLEDMQGIITHLEVVELGSTAELRAQVSISKDAPQGAAVLALRKLRQEAKDAFVLERAQYLTEAQAHADDPSKPSPAQLRPQFPPELELAAAMRVSDSALSATSVEGAARAVNGFELYGAAFTPNKVK